MPKYKIIYMSDPSVEVNDAVLTLVNQAPSPLPPPSQAWSTYKHDGKTVLEISTTDPDAALVIVAPTGSVLGHQNVRASLGMVGGQTTRASWSSAPGGMRVDLVGGVAPTSFDLTAGQLPPQPLKVVVKRPVLAPS